MKLESILLGVLTRHPSTGYDLRGYLNTHGRFLRSNTQMSQVYRALAHMEERGWVEHVVESRPGATDAKRYHVTEAGAVVFLEWLTSPYQPPSRFGDPELGARITFAGFMSREQLLEILDVELETRRKEVLRYRHRDRREAVESSVPFDTELAELVGEFAHRMGAEAMDAHIAAVDRLRNLVLDTPSGIPDPDLTRMSDPRS